MKKKLLAAIIGATAACLALAACDTSTDPSHTHEYSEKYEHNTTHHWQECECGEKKGEAVHTPGDWIVDTEATNTADGARHKVCTTCDYITVSETIHTFSTENHDAKYLAVAATTESAAKYYYSCVVCGTSENNADHTFAYGDSLDPDSGHDHTYTVWGSDDTKHWKECSCGEGGKQNEDDHTVDTWTETDAEYHSGTCSVCDKPAKSAHTYDKEIVDAKYLAVAATTENAAKYYYSCECGRSEQSDGHTFTNAPLDPDHEHTYTVWGSDDTKHWKECSCGEGGKQEEVDHTYTNGTCVCGKTNGFEDYILLVEGDLDVTRTDTANSVKVSATDPDGTDWHIKLSAPIDDDIVLGHYYEVTYAIKSNVAGNVLFETNSVVDNYDFYTQRSFALVASENIVKFTFRANKTESDPKAILQLGALPANFEVEVTSVACEEKANVGNYIDGWNKDVNSSGSPDVTVDTNYNSDGTLTVSMSGMVNHWQNEDNSIGKDGWHVKLAKDIKLTNGQQYELTLIYSVSGGGEGNAKYAIYDDVASVDYSGDNSNNGLMWYNSQYDDGKLMKKTITFTANSDVTKGSCFELGEWTDTDSDVVFTVFYMELTPAPNPD